MLDRNVAGSAAIANLAAAASLETILVENFDIADAVVPWIPIDVRAEYYNSFGLFD